MTLCRSAQFAKDACFECGVSLTMVVAPCNICYLDGKVYLGFVMVAEVLDF